MFPENCRAAEPITAKRCIPTTFAPAALPLSGFRSGRCSRRAKLVRAVTEPMSAEKMHALAQNIRKDGNDLFFAALEEELC